MLFNPIHHLSSLIIKFIVRRLNLPTVFMTVATSLFTISRSLIRSEGLLPTLQVLNSINREIMRRGTLTNLLTNTRLNPAISARLISILSGSWGDCLAHSVTINKYYKWYIFGIVFSRFHTVLFYLLRLLAGLILSSLGILFSESLSSIPY